MILRARVVFLAAGFACVSKDSDSGAGTDFVVRRVVVFLATAAGSDRFSEKSSWVAAFLAVVFLATFVARFRAGVGVSSGEKRGWLSSWL